MSSTNRYVDNICILPNEGDPYIPVDCQHCAKLLLDCWRGWEHGTHNVNSPRMGRYARPQAPWRHARRKTACITKIVWALYLERKPKVKTGDSNKYLHANACSIRALYDTVPGTSQSSLPSASLCHPIRMLHRSHTVCCCSLAIALAAVLALDYWSAALTAVFTAALLH